MVLIATLWRCGCIVSSHGSLGLLGAALGRAEQERGHGQHQHQERRHRRHRQQDTPVGGPVPGGALCGKHVFITTPLKEKGGIVEVLKWEGLKWSSCASDPTGYIVKVALGSCFCWPHNSKIPLEACVRDSDPAVKRHSSEAGTALRGRGKSHTHTHNLQHDRTTKR